MVNRNRWSENENKVLVDTVKSARTMQEGFTEASAKLARSKRSCELHWYYLKGETPFHAQSKAKKKLKAKLKVRGVRVHGNKVYIKPTEGIQVIFES